MAFRSLVDCFGGSVELCCPYGWKVDFDLRVAQVCRTSIAGQKDLGRNLEDFFILLSVIVNMLLVRKRMVIALVQ
ncbi:hypothetical protein VNO77_16692 [Canavalia gladiata]|uniref:Uncharacterized protein n=1 Tax=Canavalia gladiata TaxID=3824 RepID=A0AAN9LL37_CANGL